MRWRSFVAVGDSFTEGMNDITPDGRMRGWADLVAQRLAAQQDDFRYANLAIRGRLFEGQPTKKRRRRKRPVKHHQALGRVFGELGKAKLANNLNQLAKAVNAGSLPVTPDTEKALREACAEVQWLRKTLMEALGLQG